MKEKIRVLISETFDPWFNLATENWIFHDMDPEVQTLFLWRNEETVVIGRFQNPWSECNTKKMDEDKIKLARRQSGGGAVFHDLGNTNFTFLSHKKNADKGINNEIILNALKSYGLKVYASGRNDLLIETPDGPKKISGSAFKETKDRSFHHGTLLLSVDMSKLALYLNPHVKKLESKGIASVRARVANLTDFIPTLTHESISQRIIEEFFKYYNFRVSVEILGHEYLKTIPTLNEHFLKMKDWNWRFGEAPEFTHQMTEFFAWGMMDVHLDVHKGIVEKAQIFSDSLHPEMVEFLVASLIKTPYTKNAFSKSIQKIGIELPMIKDYLFEFENWICKEIN